MEHLQNLDGLMSSHTPTIGSLRNRILFQSEAKVQNAQYGYDYTWTDLFTIWAEIKQNPGLLFTKGDNEEPTITHIINVRYRTDITRNLRIFHNSNEYVIHRILPIDEGNNRFIQLHVELKDTQG